MRRIALLAVCSLCSVFADGSAQQLQQATRVWSVGPLVHNEPVTSIAVGPNGPTFSKPHISSQTTSVFSATRSVVFAGDRVIVAAQEGMRKVEGAQIPAEVYQILSLALLNGAKKDKREFLGFASLPIFATADDHVVVAGRQLLRLTPELKDAGTLEQGTKYGSVENVSPDGTTLDDVTSPGLELIDSASLHASVFTKAPAVATSVNKVGFVTDNVHWTGDYPDESGFVTYYDASGDHLLYHGKCGGRPQFLTADLILEPGCKNPLIINTEGKLARTIDVKQPFSYAGVSQNGKRFALQLGGA